MLGAERLGSSAARWGARRPEPPPTTAAHYGWPGAESHDTLGNAIARIRRAGDRKRSPNAPTWSCRPSPLPLDPSHFRAPAPGHPAPLDAGTVEESAYDIEEKRMSEAFARACATRLAATYSIPCDEDLDQRAWLVDPGFPNVGASDVQDTTMERSSLPVSDGYLAAGDQLALA